MRFPAASDSKLLPYPPIVTPYCFPASHEQCQLIWKIPTHHTHYTHYTRSPRVFLLWGPGDWGPGDWGPGGSSATRLCTLCTSGFLKHFISSYRHIYNDTNPKSNMYKNKTKNFNSVGTQSTVPGWWNGNGRSHLLASYTYPLTHFSYSPKSHQIVNLYTLELSPLLPPLLTLVMMTGQEVRDSRSNR